MNNFVRMIVENEIMSGGSQKETSFAGEKGGGGVRATQHVYIYNIFFLRSPLRILLGNI